MDEKTRSLYWDGKDDDGLPVEQGTNHLLVVGVDKYADHPDIPELHNAIRDAKDIANVLVNDFGFELPESRALYGENATRRNIRKALKDLNAGENDNVILYFAGHGYYSQHLNRGFFVPYDGESGEEDDSFLKHLDIQDYIAAMKARHIFLLMDSCFSGGMFRGGRGDEKIDFERAARNRERLRSRLCLTSGQFNEKVSDGYVGNNSPFARAVLQYLGHEQMIFSGDLIRHIIKTVPNNANQQPDGGVLQMVDDHRGEMILRRARRDSDLLHRIQKADWSEKAALVAQFKELFPKSEYRREVLQIGVQADEYYIWQKVNRQSENAIELFLEDYAGSIFADEARELLNKLVAKRKAQDTEAARKKAEREAAEKARREAGPTVERKRETAVAPPLHAAQQMERGLGGEAHFTETIKGVSFTMRYIPGGTYQMGDVMGDKEYDNETVHPTTVADFYLAETVVTQELYEAVMGQNPSHFKGKDLPVEWVSWNDAQAFIQKLNELRRASTPSTGSGTSATGYRLPTEAEWEYAAREGGKKVRFGNGKDIADPKEMNFNASAEHKKPYSVAGEYRGKTTPVKTFKPNALGLHDMSGNVWEWCQDWFASYPKSSDAGYAGPEIGSYRVLRGGGWLLNPRGCRTANRRDSTPGTRSSNFGFRLCLSV